MRYCIAIDGGGSKTDAVLFDETGHILRRHEAGAATRPTSAPKMRMDSCRLGTLCARPRFGSVRRRGRRVLPNGDIYSESAARAIPSDIFEDDGCNLISGTLGHSDGCGMVCGTRSSLFVRVSGQPLRHIGGKGYLIDTGGSGSARAGSAVHGPARGGRPMSSHHP